MRALKLQILPRTDQFYTLQQTNFVTFVDILSTDFNVCKMYDVLCSLCVAPHRLHSTYTLE